MPTAAQLREARDARDARVSSAPGSAARGSGAARLVGYLAIGIAGVVVALLASWVSRGVWRPGPLALPWGVALGIGGSASGVWLARVWTSAAGFAAAAGWLVGIAYLLAGGPGGDFLIINDWLGNGFLLLGSLLVIVTAGWGSWQR